VTPAATPRLTDYDIILVNSSAGKDSQATLDVVAGAAREAGVLDRLVVAHTDLGDAEWDGVPQLAAEHAAQQTGEDLDASGDQQRQTLFARPGPDLLLRHQEGLNAGQRRLDGVTKTLNRFPQRFNDVRIPKG